MVTWRLLLTLLIRSGVDVIPLWTLTISKKGQAFGFLVLFNSVIVFVILGGRNNSVWATEDNRDFSWDSGEAHRCSGWARRPVLPRCVCLEQPQHHPGLYAHSGGLQPSEVSQCYLNVSASVSAQMFVPALAGGEHAAAGAGWLPHGDGRRAHQPPLHYEGESHHRSYSG